MSIPVVLIHRGTSERYPLDVVINHAKRFGNVVTLIHDAIDAEVNIEDYDSVAKEFEARYEHLSSNHVEFERFCISRWFILREFMARNQIQDCLYIDSDVLLFCNVTDEWEKWGKGFDFTLALGTSPATSYFSYQGLYKFCDWVYNVYADKTEVLQEFRRIFAEMQRQNLAGGICDMTLFKFYRERTNAPIGEMARVIDGATWDHNINSSDGFKRSNGIKQIDWLGNRGICPIGTLQNSDDVRFNSLHFQGQAKRLIREYAR